MIHIGGRTFELVHEHKTAWNAEAFRDRYSDVLERYDYIIGDWGYGQLRLKGFFRDNHPKATKDSSFYFMSDYVSEYCNFGCPYFVLQKTATSKKPDLKEPGAEPESSESAATVELVEAVESDPEAMATISGSGSSNGAPVPRQRPHKSRNRGSRSSGKPKHVEGKPAEGRTGEGKPAEGRANEGKSAEGRSHESKPAESRQTEAKVAVAKESRGGEGRSGEGKSSDNKSVATKVPENRGNEGRQGEGRAKEHAVQGPRSSEGRKREPQAAEKKPTEPQS
ncbi:YutD-like domain-containing protein [Paenibacillus daejeonensis]|uniref:YutD-like domain-containing protein n=1 Tax=Paenibacillus daejeonensis TaxID=135193 RepID=UPI00037EE1DE|nr:YutD-like domain-containing protein [Paenibacillus daejeonensis]